MIKSFRHKGVQLFFETGSRAKIQAAHASRLQRQLMVLNRAAGPGDMDVPGWRLTFAFDGQDAILVDYQDYH